MPQRPICLLFWLIVQGFSCLPPHSLHSVCSGYTEGSLLGTFELDLLCVATIAVISGLNLLLVLGFRLTVPYVSVFKYTYLALPFLCLLAASIADKGAGLLGSVEWKKKSSGLSLCWLGWAGFGVCFAS